MEIIRAERQTVRFFEGLEVDGYRMPNGEFRVGITGASTVLGYSEVKTVEYVDRTIASDGTAYDGVGITYIQKRYGFKSTRQAWDWLEQVGMGKMSDYWKHELKAVEASVLPRECLSELDRLYRDSGRQQWLGES